MKYASLQLYLNEDILALSERIIYTVTSYMDTIGMMPSDSGSAERVVRFVRTEKGCTVYDDCAERMDTKALDGLGLVLSGKFDTHSVGVLKSDKNRMLRLYDKGNLKDIFCTSEETFDKLFCKPKCRNHSKKWRVALKNKDEKSMKTLEIAFYNSKQKDEDTYSLIKELLDLDDTTNFGFASVDDANLSGVITLYFCSANKVSQKLIDRIFSPFKQRRHVAGALKGSFYRYSWGSLLT